MPDSTGLRQSGQHQTGSLAPNPPDSAEQYVHDRAPRGRATLVAALTTLIIVGPYLLAEWPRERSRWIMAAAYQTRLNGFQPDETGRTDAKRLVTARAESRDALDLAITADPDHAELLALRARWLLEDAIDGGEKSPRIMVRNSTRGCSESRHAQSWDRPLPNGFH